MEQINHGRRFATWVAENGAKTTRLIPETMADADVTRTIVVGYQTRELKAIHRVEIEAADVSDEAVLTEAFRVVGMGVAI